MMLEKDDYDSPWKEALEAFFPEFMAFYFPDIHAAIDWSKGYVFLDKELQAVVQDAELGRRFVDKLVQVTAADGSEQWIYIHVEVQGWPDSAFPERVFIYNYRLFDRYHQPIVSLAVLADNVPNWRPSSYETNMLGCQHSFVFPMVKLLDYAGQEDDLLKKDNAFALVTAAHISTQATQKDMPARAKTKLKLVRLLYERGWDRQRVLSLFAVIDWMMRLPEALADQLWQQIEALEEERKMPYVTSIERIGIRKGIQQGRVEGRAEGQAHALLRLLHKRFGNLSPDLEDRVRAANEEFLDLWTDRILDAKSLSDVFGSDKSH